jgi:hypothetical protein
MVGYLDVVVWSKDEGRNPKVVIREMQVCRECESSSLIAFADEPNVDNKYPNENDDGDGLKE